MLRFSVRSRAPSSGIMSFAVIRGKLFWVSAACNSRDSQTRTRPKWSSASSCRLLARSGGDSRRRSSINSSVDLTRAAWLLIDSLTVIGSPMFRARCSELAVSAARTMSKAVRYTATGPRTGSSHPVSHSLNWDSNSLSGSPINVTIDSGRLKPRPISSTRFLPAKGPRVSFRKRTAM